MKKVLTLTLVGFALLLFFGCSELPPTKSDVDHSTSFKIDHSVALSQRPDFVDTRPPEVIASFMLGKSKTPLIIAGKRPEPPPDDTTTGDPNPNPANKYAYIVGISDYEGTANDLNYCDEDAEAMKSWLQGEGFTCRMDLDMAATADNIIAGLQWLVDNAEPGDEIAISYSGHGMRSPEGSAIISSDLYYITHGYVMSYFNAANCTKKLVAIDACVIGDFNDDAEDGTFVATASDRRYSYDAPDLEHGAWTYYWLNGVEDVGLIYAEDAAPHAEEGMLAWASLYRVKVDPTHTDKYTGEMDM